MVELDLEKVFDRVNPAKLRGEGEKRLQDTRALVLMRRDLKAGVRAEGRVGAHDEGTPHGGPRAPRRSHLLRAQRARE